MVHFSHSVEGTPRGSLNGAGIPPLVSEVSRTADKRAHALLPIGTPRGLSAKSLTIPRDSFLRFRGVAGNGVRVPLVVISA
jgi:hypothetical protein